MRGSDIYLLIIRDLRRRRHGEEFDDNGKFETVLEVKMSSQNLTDIFCTASSNFDQGLAFESLLHLSSNKNETLNNQRQ